MKPSKFKLSHFSRISSAIAASLGLLALIGWLSGASLLTSFGSNYIPMAPNTALCFILMGVALTIPQRYHSQALPAIFLRMAALTVFALPALTLFQILTKTELGIDSWIIRVSGKFGEVALGAMSSITAFAFTLSGVAAGLLFTFYHRSSARQASAFLSSCVFSLSLILVLSYLYGAPLLYGRIIIPVALTTSIAFSFLSMGLIALAGAACWPLSSFMGDRVRARLLRCFMPVVAFGIFLPGWMTRWRSITQNPALTAGALAFVTLTLVVLLVARLSRYIEGTMERLQLQLLQSQKLEGIGRLAGGIAHDFNNLLAVVLSFSEFLADDLPDTDPKKQDIAEIQKAAKRGVALTRQLLIFSRNEMTKPTVVNLNEVILGMEKFLQKGLGEDIEFQLHLSDSLWKTEIDPGHLEMVLMNLVLNARDAMPKGGRLTIETSNFVLDKDFAQQHIGSMPGEYLLVSVSDTGCGMAKEVLSRIFEPFYTTKPEEKGTGLGLATAYGAIKQAGGNIWVYSEVGIGTTFKIYLPASQKEMPATLSQAKVSRSLHGKETILVVEDETSVREMICRILRQAGYTVLNAASGPDAIQLVVEQKPTLNLLLTDLVLPTLSGNELSRDLKERYPALGVLFMSGYAGGVVSHHKMIDVGFSFLQKPFTREELLSQVRAILDPPV